MIHYAECYNCYAEVSIDGSRDPDARRDALKQAMKACTFELNGETVYHMTGRECYDAIRALLEPSDER